MSDRTDKSVRSVLAKPTPDEKFTAKFDEKLVEPPNEKYVKPVIQQPPLTINIQVQEKKKNKGMRSVCSIQ